MSVLVAELKSPDILQTRRLGSWLPVPLQREPTLFGQELIKPTTNIGAKLLNEQIKMEPWERIKNYDKSEKMWKRLILAVARTILIGWLMTSLQVWSDRSFALQFTESVFWSKSGDDGPWYWSRRLPDVAMDFFQKFSWYTTLPVQAADWALNSFVVGGFIASMFGGVAMNCVIGWADIMSAAYGARMISMPMTPLPPSDSRCPLFPISDGLSVGQYLGRGFQVVLGMERTCTDKLFSGHTATACTILYLYWKYSQWKSFYAYALVHFSLTIVLIIACRNHYTVDVVVGIIVTSLIICIYELLDRLGEKPKEYKQIQGDDFV